MTSPSPAGCKRQRIPTWAAFLIIAAVTGLLLHLLLDTPLWEASLGSVLLTTLAVVPEVLWRTNHRRWARAWLVLVPLLGLPLSYIDGAEACLRCGTHRNYAALGWGVGGAWVRVPVWRATRPSRAFADFFDGGHEHAWKGSREHMRGAFLFNTILTGGYKACGSGYLNRFCSRYEDDGAFRDLVQGKMRAGEVSADQVRLLLGLSMNFHRHASVPPGTHALVKKAGEWMGEHFWPPESEEAWPPERPEAR